MSTLSVATVKSLSTTPPVFQRSDGTERGQLIGVWCNFSGSGTPSINDSFNVSSISDNGTGRFSVNFTTAFANGNYTIAGSHNSFNDGVACVGQDGSNTTNSSKYSMLVSSYNALTDASEIRVLFIGDL